MTHNIIGYAHSSQVHTPVHKFIQNQIYLVSGEDLQQVLRTFFCRLKIITADWMNRRRMIHPEEQRHQL